MARKLRVGFHVSISGGIQNSVTNAEQLHCTAFQIFTRSPRRWQADDIEQSQAGLFIERLRASKIEKESVAVHMPYLPNLASSATELYEKSVGVLSDEVDRCALLGVEYLVIHLGNHGGKGTDHGIRQLSGAINTALDAAKAHSQNQKVMILLENSAGQSNSLGSSFKELRLILDSVHHQGSIGVCIDTCHAFASGHDIRTAAGVDAMIGEFDEQVGLERLKWIHLNDSKDPLLSHRDRHEHIGRGKIGPAGMKAFLDSEMAGKAPVVMETPRKTPADDAMNMETVRSLTQNAR